MCKSWWDRLGDVRWKRLFDGHHPRSTRWAWRAVPCNSRLPNTAVSSKVGRAVPYFYGKFQFRNGVVATWTISGSGGGKATLRSSHSGGVVDRISRAAVTERVVLTGCLLSIPAIYSLTNDNVCKLSQLLIRLPEQTNQYLRTKYKHKQ